MATEIISSLHVELLQAVQMREEALWWDQHQLALQNSIPAPPPAPALKVTKMCAVCDSPTRMWSKPLPPTDLVSCSHDSFCYPCWKSWIVQQINNGSAVITCPSSACTLCFHDIKSVLTRNGVVTSSFVDMLDERLLFIELQKCGTPVECSKCKAVSILETQDCADDSCEVASCGHCSHEMCTKCLQPRPSAGAGGEAHNCNANGNAAQVAGEEFLARAWILRNTKRCPSCKIPIQKNEGCSHMRCISCKYEFCWICLGKYIPGRHVMGDAVKCNCNS